MILGYLKNVTCLRVHSKMSLLASLNINKFVCVLALTVFMFCTGKAHKMEGDIIPESVKGARCQDAHHHPGLLKELRK